ncbi:hypothetical protein ACH5RR_008717 [Cinchona calisaya]|uniref:Uncharacterized protein n=1 Tax=Cinchona calisaya TaxID=153742 RepID=A0ABD3AG22_9GENT
MKEETEDMNNIHEEEMEASNKENMIDGEMERAIEESKLRNKGKGRYPTNEPPKEFSWEVVAKKRAKNTVADHLSRLEGPMARKDDEMPINETFSEEHLMIIEDGAPWYADIGNFLTVKIISSTMDVNQRKKFLPKKKYYIYDDTYLYRHCKDQVIRWYISERDVQNVLFRFHSSQVGGHHCQKGRLQ